MDGVVVSHPRYLGSHPKGLRALHSPCERIPIAHENLWYVLYIPSFYCRIGGLSMPTFWNVFPFRAWVLFTLCRAGLRRRFARLRRTRFVQIWFGQIRMRSAG